MISFFFLQKNSLLCAWISIFSKCSFKKIMWIHTGDIFSVKCADQHFQVVPFWKDMYKHMLMVKQFCEKYHSDILSCYNLKRWHVIRNWGKHGGWIHFQSSIVPGMTIDYIWQQGLWLADWWFWGALNCFCSQVNSDSG